MAEKFFGSFYFTIAPNGVLKGEYTNNRENTVNGTETAQKSDGNTAFEGEYKTKWSDPEGEYKTTLTIKQLEGSENFALHWAKENNPVAFQGIGMVRNNMLIGYYELG